MTLKFIFVPGQCCPFVIMVGFSLASMKDISHAAYREIHVQERSWSGQFIDRLALGGHPSIHQPSDERTSTVPLLKSL